jgi:fructosamine-3-kinase
MVKEFTSKSLKKWVSFRLSQNKYYFMPLPDEVKKSTEEILEKELKKNTKIISCISVGGGSINDAYKLNTSAGTYFIKVNQALKYPGMFDAEIKGLNLFAAKTKFIIPKPIASGISANHSFLILEYLNQGTKTNFFFDSFGGRLAEMHQQTQPAFGFDDDNYIGSLKQSNKNHFNWIGFFIEERLEKQLKMVIDKDGNRNKLIAKFEKLYKRLNELLPEEKPALLHGDLWSGNYMAVGNNEVSIFDPAVYYGHREMDIAMTKLFGGFDSAFYSSYNEAFPLEKNWEERMDLCNLYPLLVHVNLFGGSYMNDVEQIINKYVS